MQHTRLNRKKLLGQPLTRRETQAAEQLIKGASNKLIADEMKISDSTAKFHVMSIIRKLGAESRTDAAVKYVLRHCTCGAPRNVLATPTSTDPALASPCH